MKKHICFGGCQWDAMMLWMYNNGIYITQTQPKDITGKQSSKNSNSSCITGSAETDKLANIYDTIGCTYDWSMEWYHKSGDQDGRVGRGGCYVYDVSPGGRVEFAPNTGISGLGSRLTLYIQDYDVPDEPSVNIDEIYVAAEGARK